RTYGAGRSSPGGNGAAVRDDLGLTCVALSRAGAGLPADAVAAGKGAGGGAALGRDADRGNQRQGGLDGVPRPGSTGAEGLARSQAGRGGGGGVGARAHDLVVVGSPQAKRRRAERQSCPTARQAEDAAQTYTEDGLMLPQLLPMLAVPATPFDSPEYSFE